jgi:trk system potassium uptake protein TrkH
VIAGGLGQAVRRGTVGVDVSAALNLVGAVLKYLSLTFLLPIGVALVYRESPWSFVAAGAITGAVGWSLERATRGKEHVGTREGFLVVGLTWLLVAGAGMLPYLFAEDQLSRPVDAYFEAMSGFTTTGSSVLTDIPELSHGMLIWRQFTQWLGGMGIVVLALAVLPRLRVGGRQLFESEAPGPEIEKLTASIRETARRLWLLYVGLSVAMIAVLTFFAVTRIDPEMTFFDAVANTFGALPTGGFTTRARSYEDFAAASQWATVFFMLLAGANFALLYAVLIKGRARLLRRDEEFRLYLALLALGSLLLTLELLAEGLQQGEAAIRHATFQAVSTMTTTGFASTDFNEWSFLALVILVGLMFFGGSAGSTAGSVKVVRHVLIGRILRRELDQTLHPEAVSLIRYNGNVVDERALRAAIAFVLLYVGVFALGTLALMLDAAVQGPELTPLQAIAASASTLANVGPSLGFAGPMGSFEPFSDLSTVIMTVLMWVGRLEIIPVAVLLTRAYWRA